MSDRCYDHKARACRRCAASPLDAALALVREGADTQHTTSLTWQESRALLDHLEKSAEWEATANRFAALFEAEYERAEQAVAARDSWHDKAVDEKARADKAEQERDEALTALTAAREDIRNRRREFTRLNADNQYLLALDDAFGLVSNRWRDVLSPADPTKEGKPDG